MNNPLSDIPMHFPKFLYRGDSDPLRARKLKETWGSHGFLLTNMADSGNPLEIFNVPMLESIKRHIDLGWQHTHFLSFSKSRCVALRFAAGLDAQQLRPAQSQHWDAVVLTFDLSKLSRVYELEPGVLRAIYPGRNTTGDTNNFGYTAMRMLANHEHQGKPIEILLVDVVSQIRSCIGSRPDLVSALMKAETDQEWLVLPLNIPNGDLIGHTACLDDACLLPAEKFVFFSQKRA